uniref:Uncharacterized protein n=1 Tax=Eucampia antarctica TaxID=49252 RepID=A0A7S2W5C1_9STRA|eukprot:CAMPEP_0197832118 /NCGR_PEP_ID=MMETSP1437-20131217/13390_1 /TAXON_ID=49252 ORGANISM="Eucampia antarctica, Strain CCMP1452" /NCGR_SAMPLE_ID=MMETSP1437 /ASSEMBLY_ACC=CAM_ASM_001096 /LENGTH=128 /DNA_ID=CAMNT_0043435321 /DNA_START=148 /DNA_END=534 /DNA_ORIENTATION=+
MTKIYASILPILYSMVLLSTMTYSFAFTVNPVVCRHSQVILKSSGSEEESMESQSVKCPKCDRCDGSGRIAGGIGAIFPWIPIKAFRPCPNFIEAGGRYTRTGQPLDEIAFGRGNLNRGPPADPEDDY